MSSTRWEVCAYMNLLHNRQPRSEKIQPGKRSTAWPTQSPSREASRLFFVPDSINTESIVLLFYGYFVLVKGIYTWSAIKAAGTAEELARTTAPQRKTESTDIQTKWWHCPVNGMNRLNLSLSKQSKQKKKEWGKVQQSKTTWGRPCGIRAGNRASSV